MHAQVITLEIPPERRAEAAIAVEERTTHSVRSLPGFRGAYWLADDAEQLFRALLFSDAERGRGEGEWLPDLPGARVRGAEAYEVVARVGARIIGTAAFCRSLVWQEDPGRIEQAIARVEGQVIPGVRRNAGFEGGFWLADRRTGRCAGFTLWDTAEHLATSGAVGRDLRREPARPGELTIVELREYSIVARIPPAS
jgi:hypothetical protein